MVLEKTQQLTFVYDAKHQPAAVATGMRFGDNSRQRYRLSGL